MADLPIKELGDQAPEYDRPHVTVPDRSVINSADVRAARQATPTRC